MNEMYKTIIEQYEKDGYESAKKSFMDFVNADRSDVTKDEVMLSYAMMAKLALVNKDSEMAEKLLRLDSKFANSSEESQLDSKADEPRDKPEQENSANVKNVLGMEFVELYPYVCVSRKTISDADVKRIVAHSYFSIGSWDEADNVCSNMSSQNPYYEFRLPTEKEFLDIIKCHKEKGIQLEPPSIYEWTSDYSGPKGRILINCNAEKLSLKHSPERDNTAFRVIMKLKH